MRSFPARISIYLVAACIIYAQDASTHAPRQTESQSSEVKGMPPRSAPGDYPAHVQGGKFTVASEFAGHSVPRPEGPLSTEDYIVVEACVFGSSGARLTLSSENFSLRI